MKEAAEVARKERDRRAGGGSVHDRIAGRAEYREREQALRKEEVSAAFDPPGLVYWWALTGTCVLLCSCSYWQGKDFSNEIRAQMLERLERNKRKKELREKGSRYRRCDDDEDGGKAEESGSDDGGSAKTADNALRKKKKPKFLF